MATTYKVTRIEQVAGLLVSEVTVTWDNSDLTAGDIVHGLPKGVKPFSLGVYGTTAGTNIGTFTYAFDQTNGEVDIVALQETGGTIANLVTVHTFATRAQADQTGGSLSSV